MRVGGASGFWITRSSDILRGFLYPTGSSGRSPKVGKVNIPVWDIAPATQVDQSTGLDENPVAEKPPTLNEAGAMNVIGKPLCLRKLRRQSFPLAGEGSARAVDGRGAWIGERPLAATLLAGEGFRSVPPGGLAI